VCATHVNGDACGVSISLPRDRAERRILDSIEADLFNPARLSDLEARCRAGATRSLVDHSRRIGELESEIRTIGDAVAQGCCRTPWPHAPARYATRTKNGSPASPTTRR
jgi:hypothetical protein